MIQSWKTDDLKDVFEGRLPKGFQKALFNKTRRLLAQMNAATDVEELRSPPGNGLHKLTGDLDGKWALKVNDQYRIVFKWSADGPEEVWFGDYH